MELWVFTILAGILGWVLRWLYDERRITELNKSLKAKEDDIFHLNEAHNLLLKDKQSKIDTHDDDLILKDRVIAELNEEISTLRSMSSKYLDAADANLEIEIPHKVSHKKSGDSASIVSMIDRKAKKKNGHGETSSDFDDSSKPKQSDVTKSSSDINEATPKLSKKEKLKLELKEKDAIIKTLSSERDELIKKLSDQPKEIIKERPITITKTILVKEKVDRKKLKKALSKIPFKTSKKVVSEKKKKGKLKIVD